MAERDAMDLARRDAIAKEFQSGLPRGLLQIAGDDGDFDIADGDWETEIRSQTTHELDIAIRLGAAQPMIQVQQVKPQIPSRGKLAEDVEEADRVGAPGYGDTDRAASLEHGVTIGEGGDAVEQHTPQVAQALMLAAPGLIPATGAARETPPSIDTSVDAAGMSACATFSG